MTTTFASLGVPEQIVRDLARRGITEPFPIQAATLPDGLAGRDLCGKAPTGSGKTLAFGIPMISRVTRSAPKRPKGLILAPTRELALQVADELRAMSGDLRVLAVYGGAGIEPQIKALRNGVDIVVACPGRLLDVIDRKACDLRDVSFVVLDEADRMADMGFLPDVRRILDQTNEKRQTVLFSATLDGAVDKVVKQYQHDPAVHELPDEPSGHVPHHFWMAERHDRLPLLAKIIDRVGPTIVFCRTKHGSDRVARQLGNTGIKAAAIHGNRSQAQRERALTAFHRGDVAALVATDVAARGIHVEGVTCVVHFDIPADPKDYIHRSGRTGRAGADGVVVSFVDGAQRKDAVKLKKDAGFGALELTAPDVGSLPEGAQRRFRPEKANRSAAPTRSEPSARSHSDRPNRPAPERRPESTRSESSSKARPESRARPERSERSTRPERSARPARPASAGTDERGRPRGHASARRPGDDDRPRSGSRPDRAGSDRPHGARVGDDRPRSAAKRDDRPRSDDRSPARQNRSSRRDAQFSDEDRADRTAAKAARRAEIGDDRRLPADVAGAHKVRPSGASRRKAKRETLIAAGEPLPKAKKRRSGKPRPPARNRP
jgi:superfamily II DNA/RNA helicase